MKHSWIRRRIVLWSFAWATVLVWCMPIAAGELGMPRLRAFLPEEYGGDTDVFDVAQDGRGVLFFALASDGGVLSYDGARWVPISTGGAPRALETDAQGRVWVGGGIVGYLEVGSEGAVRYRSLTEHVPEAVEVFDIGDIATGPYGVAFVDSRHLLVWDGASFAHWQAAEGQSFGGGMTVQETLFVPLVDGGALRLEGDQLVAVPWLEEHRIRTLLPYEDADLLIVSSRTGPGCVLRLDADGVKRSFSAALDRMEAGRTISTAATLQGGGLAVTTQDALFVLDRQGGVVSRIGPAQGLDPLSVTALHQDRQGSLWISQQDGIRRLALSLPITGYGASEGLPSSATSTIRFGGKLYAAATDSGLRVLMPGADTVPARFEPVPGVEARTYDLAVVGDTLLAGTSEGVLALDTSGRVETLAEGYLVTVAESVSPEHAFAGFERRVVVLSRGDEGWRVLQDVRDVPVFAYMMAEGRPGELWLWGFEGELVRLSFADGYDRPPKIERMHEEQSWAGFEHVAGELLFFRTGGGVDRQGVDGGLEPDPRFAEIDWHDRPEGITNFMHLVEDAEGGVWLIGDRGFTRLVLEGELFRVSSSHRLATDVDLNLTGYRDQAADTVLWLGHDRGLLRYDFGAQVDLPTAAPVIHRTIEQVESEAEVRVTEVDGVPTQPFGRGPVIFTYGLPHFVHERAVDYQVRLVGFDQDWADWTVETRKEYTNLPEGDYRFEVRARYFGRPVEAVASYVFEVLPPWYRSWWAYLLWAALAACVVSLVVAWRSRLLAAETRRLGALVDARTAELAREKQQVEAQASTLEERAAELRGVNRQLQREMQATREANEARQRLEARVQEAQRLESLGVLAGGIAHDFNNLLVGVVGNAELAQQRVTDAEVDRHLESIVKASGMAADLCRQMLAYAGKAPFDRTKVALDEMASDMTDLLRSSLGRQTALRVEAKTPGAWVEGDSSQLRQVLLNLAINAGEATGEMGHVIIRCGEAELDEATMQQTRGGETLEPGRYAYLEVEDDGEGMDEETVARVFEPFYSTKFLGRGLGLAVVFGIVRRHHGAVTIDSRLARGTRVRVYLPSTEPPPSDRPAESTAVAPGRAPEDVRGSVLIVDDEAFVRQVAETAVNEAGFEAIVTEGGEEALQMFAQRREAIRCVLLDLSMPEMDGRATFRALRDEAPELPVILMSGYGEHEVSNQFPEQKPSAFLTKPFSLDTLQETVRRVTLLH